MIIALDQSWIAKINSGKTTLDEIEEQGAEFYEPRHPSHPDFGVAHYLIKDGLLYFLNVKYDTSD